jgi:hypothetical protein
MSDLATHKHRALIEIKIEIHDVLDTGEFSGHPVNLAQHQDYNIKRLQYHQIEGFDRHDCLMKVKQWLENIKKC